MESMSKLDYIFKSLNISGKDIAEQLGVEKTTISKWRTNQRKLNYNGRYTRRLAEILLNIDYSQNRNFIENILRIYRDDYGSLDPEGRLRLFCQWLSEEPAASISSGNPSAPVVYKPKHGYNTNVSIFLGEKGIDEALEYFMKYLLKITPGKDLYIIDCSGINWIKGDESTDKQTRIRASMDLFRPALDYGHRIIIVDGDTDIYRPYKAIFRWLNLYLSEGVEVWSHPPLQEDQDRYTTFVVKGEIALQCIANFDHPQGYHCLLYRNGETIDFLANSAEAIIKKSKKLIETVESHKFPTFFSSADKYLKLRRSVYMLNPSLTLQVAGAALLRGILKDNGADDAEIEVCVSLNRRFNRLRQRCRMISISDLRVVESYAVADKVQDEALSTICGKRITLTRNRIQELFTDIIEQDTGENGLVIFASFQNLNFVPENLGIFVQEDAYVAAWNFYKYKKWMYCVNPNVTSGFFRYLDDIWNMIPKVCKRVEWRNNQLKRAME